MAVLSKGYAFGSTELVTNAKLATLVDSATITGIVNADIDADAAIVDTKLATISTASKVNTDALTTTSGAEGDILYHNGTKWARLVKGTDTNVLTQASGIPSWAIIPLPSGTINFIIDGGGSAITTGIKGDLQIDFACTINSVTMLADQTGSIVVDIWKDTYANFPPTDADTITASAVPTISSATKSTDATLTDWTTSIAAADILRFNVDSIATCERVTIALKYTRV